MRFIPVVTVLFTLGALILSFLCLFAGSSRGFLSNGEILTLNISRIGHGSYFNTTDGDGGSLDNLLNSFQSEINDLIGDTASDIASSLNLSDYYSVHVMNLCQGMYEPNASVAAGEFATLSLSDSTSGRSTVVSRNTTYCSPRNAMFHFSPTETLSNALPSGIALSDLQWPDEITDAERTVRVASRAMVVLYILGITFTGLAFLAAVYTVFSEKVAAAATTLTLAFLGFLTLAVSSAISTAIAVKAVGYINQYGNDIGIAATKGTTFLGMTWAATGLMMFAFVLGIGGCCGGSRRRRGGGQGGMNKDAENEREKSGYWRNGPNL